MSLYVFMFDTVIVFGYTHYVNNIIIYRIIYLYWEGIP